MAYGNQAYDLSLFEVHEPVRQPEAPKAPKLREIKNPAGRKKHRVKPAGVILCGLAFAGLMAVHVTNMAVMTATRAEVKTEEENLVAIQNQENLLDVELDKLLSVQNIDAFAKEKLGLQKPEQYQVEYLTGKSETKITTQQSDQKSLWTQIGDTVSKLFSSVFGA